MDDASAPVRIETLLSHREWVRRVARALVADEHLAADLEQEVWADALERPPRVRGSLRGWLASALRNNLLNRRRSETRRARREEAVSRTEAEPSAADVVAEAESHRRVVNAVMAIEEPYRSTVLLRFFQDIAPTEIARRQGIPVETVRTRLRRALADLRRRFGAGEEGEGRRSLLLLLAPGPVDRSPWPGPVAAVTGGLLMASKPFAAAVGVAVLLVLGWFALRPVAEIPVPAPAPVVATAAPAAPPPVVAPDPAPEPPAVIEEPPAPPSPPPPPPPPKPEEVPLLVLTGTVRSTDGLAVEGVQVGFDLDSFRLRGKDGMPLAKDVVDRAHLTAKAAVTGADGKYSIEVRLPYDVTLAVVVLAPGFLPLDRGVVAIEQNLARPHDFVLERGVGVEGRVVDQEGNPVPGASVFVWETAGLSKPPRAETNYDGRFVLPDLPARAWTLDVLGGRLRDGHRWRTRSHSRIVHGGDRNLEIVLERTPLVGSRVILEVVDGSTGEAVEPAETSLNPAMGEPREWTQRDSGIRVSAGCLRLDVVEPGSWIAWARLRDGRVGWARFEVAPSDTEVRGRIEIGGTGSIGGRVDLGGLSLGPRDRLQVDAHFEDSRTFPQFAMGDDGKGGEISGHAWVNSDGTFVIQGYLSKKGLLPGRYWLRAWARGISALGMVDVRPNRRAAVELVARKVGVLKFRSSRPIPPCVFDLVVRSPGSTWPLVGLREEKREQAEWTWDLEVHPGTYTWSAGFGQSTERNSLLTVARSASGTVAVDSGETVEVVIPVENPKD